MSFMMAFGLAGVMICLGMFLRAKVPFLRNMLVPASVIAGLLGFMLMNVLAAVPVEVAATAEGAAPVTTNLLAHVFGVDAGVFTEIVNHLFTVSFISISLTSAPKGNGAKEMLKGATGLGIVWCLLYALTPLVSTGVIALLGKAFDMDPIYGMLIQFGFCQGPGQAAAFGAIFENDGWANAATVGMAFASVGFISAFLVGIPAAKLGIRRRVAKHCGELDEVTLRGYLRKEEQTEHMVKDTTVNSNLETLGFHFAVIGVCYVLAVFIGRLLAFIPSLGGSLSSMMFMNGMYAAYIVKFIMKKLKIDYLLENTLQSKITGWTSDFLVVCAFMAVSVQIISQWLVPILVVCAVTTVITFIVCFYFGARFGGSNDFERTLGIYGTCCGTVPSGISLVRIVDPNFQTATAVELGACNLVMLLCTPVYFIILLLSNGTLGMPVALGALALCVVVYMVLLKVTRLWNKPTYNLFGKAEEKNDVQA